MSNVLKIFDFCLNLTLRISSLKKKDTKLPRNYPIAYYNNICESYHGNNTCSVLQLAKSAAETRLKKQLQIKKILELPISVAKHGLTHLTAQITLQLIDSVPRYHYTIFADGSSDRTLSNAGSMVPLSVPGGTICSSFMADL